MPLRRADESGTPIMIEGADTEGHSWRGFVSEEDERVLEDALRGRAPGPVTVRIEPADEDDVEGHALATASATTVKLVLDDDDTEGHVINVHFPTAEAADAFRRRLLATGLIAATLTIGAVGAATLPNLDIGTGAGAGTAPAAAEQAWQEASINEGARQGVTDVTGWPADARIAAETGAQEAAANEAWQQASINEGARQSGATSTGPMDVNEARALQADAARADEAWQQASINEGLRQSGAEGATGPMDVNEAQALRSGAGTDVNRDVGIMDPASASASDRQAAIDAESDRLQGQADAFASNQQRALDAETDRLQGMADASSAAETRGGWEASLAPSQGESATDTRGGWEGSLAPSQGESATDTRGGWEGSLAPNQASSTDADRDIGIMDASGAAAAEGESDEDTAPPGRGGVRPR
jgi:hypothetical protein